MAMIQAVSLPRELIVRSDLPVSSSRQPGRIWVSASLFPCHVARESAVSFAAQRRSARVQKRDSVKAHAAKQTFTTFEDMVGQAETVLVDFYAIWCGPCQLMNGELQQLSEKAGNRVKIVKVDTEKYPVLASEYKVEALPTFILFHKGKAVDRLEGAMPADKLLQRIDEAVATASQA